MAEEARESAYLDPGDVGRRIAHRRKELGLTRAEVATRARMVPEYLEYLEKRPGHPTADTLLRVASALQTTAQDLLGAGRDRPPGTGAPARRPAVEILHVHECLRLISAGGVGRMAFLTEAGPAVLPVNFAVLDDNIVFRTAPDTPQAAHIDSEVGFEVDQLDEAMSEGWSVLIVGHAREVTDPDELNRIRETRPVASWVSGERDVYVRIAPTRITGRRIHADQGR